MASQLVLVCVSSTTYLKKKIVINYYDA